MKDSDRDFYLSAADAAAYGVIDKVLPPRQRQDSAAKGN